MIFTMIGGGAHRLLSTSRCALRDGVFANGGEIRYYDLNEQRAADMAAMLMKSPEYQKCPVKVSWQLTLDEALDGADVVSVTLLAGPVDVMNRQNIAGYHYGFIGSDNVSYPGAFLALRGAPILMNVAKRMEVMCPNAILLDFANPVGVLSAMVRQYTSIKCYGVCEGFNNHQWDLNRILTGEDAPNPNYIVDVAGINHLSFITRGTLDGEDLFKLIADRIEAVPNCPELVDFSAYKAPHAVKQMRDGLWQTIDFFKTRHALLFSNEGDGINHFYHEHAVANNRTLTMNEEGTGLNDTSFTAFNKNMQDAMAGRAEANRQFAEWAKMPAEEIPWNDPSKHVFHMPPRGDVQSMILCGLAGVRPMRVAVSSVNDGNILNFEDGLACEFTHIVDKDGIHPVKGLKVPTSTLGMLSSLAIHQTMLAKACGSGDAKDLYEALLAYPIGADTKAARKLWKFLLHDSEKYIAPSLMELEKYL